MVLQNRGNNNFLHGYAYDAVEIMRKDKLMHFSKYFCSGVNNFKK